MKIIQTKKKCQTGKRENHKKTNRNFFKKSRFGLFSMAESQGFEPWVSFRLHSLSKTAP